MIGPRISSRQAIKEGAAGSRDDAEEPYPKVGYDEAPVLSSRRRLMDSCPGQRVLREAAVRFARGDVLRYVSRYVLGVPTPGRTSDDAAYWKCSPTK